MQAAECRAFPEQALLLGSFTGLGGLSLARKLRLIYVSDPWCSAAIIRVSSKAETPSVHGIKHRSSSLDERKEEC